MKRFFRSLKYEEVYIKEYKDMQALRAGIARYMDFYNFNRFHSALDYKKRWQSIEKP